MIRDYHVAKPSIKGLLRNLAFLDNPDTEALVAEVIARNPDRKIQAIAYREQVACIEWLIEHADAMKNDPKHRARRRGRGQDLCGRADRQG